MKQQKAMNSDLIAYFQAWIKRMLPNSKVVDMYMENSFIIAVLQNGWKFKVKQ